MGESPYVIDYSETFSFPVAPSELWSAIEHFDSFELWWGWLSDFSLDGGTLVKGAVLHGTVNPPLPYRMKVRVELEECDPPHSIDASVHGDLEGRARLQLRPNREGAQAEVSWTIEMTQKAMRLTALVAHPMLRWGHDRVVEATVRGFRRQMAGGQPD